MANGLVIHLQTKSGKPLGTRVLDWQEVWGQMAAQLGAVATGPEEGPMPAVMRPPAPAHRDFLTIPELAERWRIARPTVYNRLRIGPREGVGLRPANGGRGRKIVPLGEILKIEAQQLKRL